MVWDVRQTYYYLVCFATLIMIDHRGRRGIGNGLDLAYPEEPYRPSAVDMYQRTLRPGPDVETATPFTREELEAMAEEEAERMRRQTQRRALRNLMGNLALLLIAAPIYAYHWKQIRAIG